MELRPPYYNYPSGWGHFERFVPIPGPAAMDLSADLGDINRFAARFRLAQSFVGLNLDGYREATAAGYSALCHVFLTWSAFEQFMIAVGVRQDQLADLLARYDTVALQRRIRELDQGDRFYRFIADRVDRRHRVQLENYFKSDPCNITYLASSIRHLFAHGSLTPNANQVAPEVVIVVCGRLASALLKIMDSDFEARIQRFLEEVYGS